MCYLNLKLKPCSRVCLFFLIFLGKGVLCPCKGLGIGQIDNIIIKSPGVGHNIPESPLLYFNDDGGGGGGGSDRDLFMFYTQNRICLFKKIPTFFSMYVYMYPKNPTPAVNCACNKKAFKNVLGHLKMYFSVFTIWD